ncbi:MAG: MMPL family transporter, partial [Gammaproteobacteria bacterium]|nr:MMPL family transporter [Gammaproteobacteria bacterium]
MLSHIIHNQRALLVSHFIWLSLLVLSLLYLFSSLHVVSDITQFMPNKHKDKDVQLLIDELQQGSTARLLIVSMSGDNAKNLANLSKQLKSKLDTNKNFLLTHNGQQNKNISALINKEYKFLFEYRYLLYPNHSFSREELSLSLKQRLTELRSGINFFKNTLSSDPQNHFFNYLRTLSERSNNTLHHGVWFNKEKTAALLLVEMNLENFNLDQQQSALDNIRSTINQLSPDNNIKTEITGTASMAVATRAAIQSTSKKLSAIALILMSLLFWWSYRSLRLFFIAMLPLISAVIAALSMTNIVFQQVHGIIIAFGITLLGVCIDYPVHLFSHHTKSQTPQQTILSIWPTLRLGVMTTALAYLAMLGTGFSGLSQLAVFAVTGLIVSLLVTRWIIPHWLSINFIKQDHHYLSYLSRFNFSFKYKFFVSFSVLLFCISAILLNYDSLWSKNISDLSPVPEQAKILDQKLRQSVGAPDVNHVFLIKDKNPENLLQRTEELVNDLQALKNKQLANTIYSVIDFFPSQKSQR